MLTKTTDEYYILVNQPEEPSKPDYFCYANGRTIKIKGFETFDLFYFKDDSDEYSISEATTGMRIVRSPEYHEARALAEMKLTRAGVEKFRDILERAREKYGLSPRYKEE
jgi:hypothetical protein